MRKVSFLLFAAVFALMAGCGGSKPKDQIVGKWKAEAPAGAPKEAAEMMPLMEFKSDGGLVMTMGPINMNGKYKFVEDDVMEVEFDIPGKGKDAKKMKVEIKGEDLTTTVQDATKEVTKFKKAK